MRGCLLPASCCRSLLRANLVSCTLLPPHPHPTPHPTPHTSSSRLCGMVPMGVRFAHGFNHYATRLGLPCPEELEEGWQDLSEEL